MITIRSLFPSPLFRRLGSLSRLVLLAGLSGLVPTASTLPAADLTVTVLENADGSTTFRLSGLSQIEEGGGSGGIGGGVSTNFGGNVAAPPSPRSSPIR